MVRLAMAADPTHPVSPDPDQAPRVAFGEQSAQENQLMLATLLANLPGMAYRCRNDAQWTMEFVSEGCCDLTGYQGEELVGNRVISYDQVILPEDRVPVNDGVQAALQRGGHFDLTYRIRTKSGDIKWVSERGRGIWAPDGALQALEGFIFDITARLQAEQALRESEQKFATAFRVSPDIMSISEFDTGCYVEVNEAHERIFGFSRAESIGRSPVELGILRVQAVRDEMLRQLITDQGRVHDFRVEAWNRQGEPVIILLSAEVIQFGGRKCVLRNSRDITAAVRVEQALRESEEKFAKAFLACPDAISVHEMESGRCVDVNEGFLRLFGCTREEVVGRTTLELGFWADPAGRQAYVEQLRSAGRVRNFSMNVRLRDGSLRLCELSAEVFEIGGRAHNVTVLHDISERRQAEQSLRDSEEKFAKAFRASPDAISISDQATGKFLDVNEGFERLSGYTRGELIGHSAQELGIWTAPEDRVRMLRELQQHGRVRNLQMMARARNGEQREFLMSVETVEIGGRPCLVILGHDISDHVLAERALRESEEKFAKAFRSSPHPLTITEMPSGRYVDVNLGFERITGYSREEVIGRTALDIGIWYNLADRQELMSRMQRDGMVRDMECSFRRKDGGRVITLCSFELVELSGRPCLLSTIEDITERRRAEEQHIALETQLRQNQKLEALGTLAGGIAHDFNNILTAIIVNQELALMDLAEPAVVSQRLSEIGRASNRAKELVRQILTFSRQQQHERLRQHLQMIIREALGLLRASLPSTIEIKQDLSPEAPPVLADASQIHQVVMNLCTNAAHAMGDRGGRLTVRLTAQVLDAAACLALPGLRPGSYARLTVADTGHGMDAAVLARIFEPFFTTKGPGEGTGLGLPMVHGIVKDHDGGIFVQSLPGVGTTFELYFPEATETESMVPVLDTDIAAGHGESVLVVDDEEAICDAIGAMLRRIGYRVETFTDARLALEKFRAGPAEFDLLLTDRTMPQMSGPELIAHAREWWPGLPALLMSGLNGPSDKDGLPVAGYGLVAKPIDIADLSRAVRHALNPALTH